MKIKMKLSLTIVAGLLSLLGACVAGPYGDRPVYYSGGYDSGYDWSTYYDGRYDSDARHHEYNYSRTRQ